MLRSCRIPKRGDRATILSTAKPTRPRVPTVPPLRPPYQQVVHLSALRGGIFLELLNAYNRKNVLDVDYNRNYTEEQNVHQLPVIPYLGLTVEF